MNAPPILRPLRRLLQRQLDPSPRPSLLPGAILSSRQVRQNASVPEPTITSKRSRRKHTSDATAVTEAGEQSSSSESSNSNAPASPPPRFPRNLAALYLEPLRREARYGVPSCNLQLRAYSPRSLEFFSDFALRAAYYLGLPATGPVPLPRLIQRWTVPKSHFIDKRSQENFERITNRRLIQIRDGHPQAVHVWLAYLRKHAYYGIGMKADVWEFSSLDVAKKMDQTAEEVNAMMEERWEHLAEGKPIDSVEGVKELLSEEEQKLNQGRS